MMDRVSIIVNMMDRVSIIEFARAACFLREYKCVFPTVHLSCQERLSYGLGIEGRFRGTARDYEVMKAIIFKITPHPARTVSRTSGCTCKEYVFPDQWLTSLNLILTYPNKLLKPHICGSSCPYNRVR